MDLVYQDATLHIDAGLGGFHKAVLIYQGKTLGSYDKQHLADLMKVFYPSIQEMANASSAPAPSAPPSGSGS